MKKQLPEKEKLLYAKLRKTIEKYNVQIKNLEDRKNKIDAKYYEFDNKKDIISGEWITKEDIKLYKNYNSEGSIPTFLVGCKYIRVGKGFSGEELEKEKQELKMVIEKVLS